MQRQSLIFALLLPSLLTGCPGPVAPPPPGELEIGTLDADGAFHALSDGDSMAVVLGANGLNMLLTSLRAREINPRKPTPDVQVDIAGQVMAAILLGAREDMVEDGDGFVLGNLQVPFQTELCCYACMEGTIQGSLRDAGGHTFEGEVTVRFERGGGCPDVRACCRDADACPDPSITQLCM